MALKWGHDASAEPRGRLHFSEETSMAEPRHDPLELWVGTWTPEEWLKRENRKREQSPAEMKAAEPHPQTGDLEKTE